MIPTLLYHSIDETFETSNVITPQLFREHLEALRIAGYRVLTLDEYIEITEKGKETSDRFVLLTFDDGYEDFYSNAWPILQEFDVTATQFLITGYMGQLNWWNHRATYFQRHLSWEQVLELSQAGMSFGVHTTSHHNLAKFSASQALDDLLISKAEIEQQLGKTAVAFSYPYGGFNDQVTPVVQQLFKIAFSVNQGTFDYQVMPHAINRFVVRSSWSPKYLTKRLDDFARKSSLGARSLRTTWIGFFSRQERQSKR